MESKLKKYMELYEINPAYLARAINKPVAYIEKQMELGIRNKKLAKKIAQALFIDNYKKFYEGRIWVKTAGMFSKDIHD